MKYTMKMQSIVNNNIMKSCKVKEGWNRIDFRIKNRDGFYGYSKNSGYNNQILL